MQKDGGTKISVQLNSKWIMGELEEWMLILRFYQYFWEMAEWEWLADVNGVRKVKGVSSQ